ncbi:hypothetical protein COT72_05260 [archaeon CG10_big_fil_rev_8_21_14_0_10_43_11]|nr:MAG: hypothetical protein COT72_05260 [archaeon CG10_big_fil_rev_8_21_14_0_10_43_11]
MRKLLFVPSGVGLGHATRTHAIINKIKKHAEYKIASYGSALKYFERQGFSPVGLRGFDYHGEYSFELLKTLVKEADLFFKLAGDYLRISKLQKDYPFDTIVSDSDPIGLISANFLKTRSVLIENLQGAIREAKFVPKRFQEGLGYQLAFLEQIDHYVVQYVDDVIVPSFDKTPFKMSKKHNVGLVINPTFDEQALRSSAKQDYICVPIPGSTLTYDIVNQLLHVFKRFPKENFFLLNFPTKTIKRVGNVYLFPLLGEDEVLSYLHGAKAVISFAGFSTLTNIAYLKKPSLILPLPNHIEQVANATFFRRNKLAEVVYPRKGYDKDLVEKALTRVLKEAKTYSENIEAMRFDFNGAQRAAQLLLKEQ